MEPANGAMKNLQIQMELDQFKHNLPYIIENAVLIAKVMKSRYDSLLAVGFTESQALEIIVHKKFSEM